MTKLTALKIFLVEQPEFKSEKERLEWILGKFLEFIGEAEIKFEVTQNFDLFSIKFHDKECKMDDIIMNGLEKVLCTLFLGKYVSWRRYISDMPTVVMSD